jgi:hypothetical protein
MAKLAALLAVGVVAFAMLAGEQLAGDDAGDYRAALEKRPYAERDLGKEYGLKPYEPPRRCGPMDYTSVASEGAKRNNMLEAEASRIQLEFEDRAGYWALLFPIDAHRIARQRFEDQGLLPKDEGGATADH